MGIQSQFAINYCATPKSAKAAYGVVSRTVGEVRERGISHAVGSLNCDVNEDGEVVSRTSGSGTPS